MPTWFAALLVICGGFTFRAAVRGLTDSGIYIWGKKVGKLRIVLALMVILLAFGIMGAIQLGFISDHAP